MFPGARDPTPITTVEGRAVAEKAARALREGALHEPGTGSLSRSQGTLVAAHISQTPPAGKATAGARSSPASSGSPGVRAGGPALGVVLS